MVYRLLVSLMTCGVLAGVCGQELNLSVAAKTYTDKEQVWVTVSVVDAAAMPGAYTVHITCNPDDLGFYSLLPSSEGPFSVTPAASDDNGTVTVAGFQGITDTGSGTTSLVTLVFVPKKPEVTIDTATFSISGNEVFSSQAEVMDLKVTKQTTTVRLSSVASERAGIFSVSRSYIRFTVPQRGMTSVRIFDMKGRTVAVPLIPTVVPSGFQAVPVGTKLVSGIYIVAVRGEGLAMTKKLEVVR